MEFVCKSFFDKRKWLEGRGETALEAWDDLCGKEVDEVPHWCTNMDPERYKGEKLTLMVDGKVVDPDCWDGDGQCGEWLRERWNRDN